MRKLIFKAAGRFAGVVYRPVQQPRPNLRYAWAGKGVRPDQGKDITRQCAVGAVSAQQGSDATCPVPSVTRIVM